MGVPQKLEQDQYSLSVSLISHVHLQIKLDSIRLQELLLILRKRGPCKWWVRDLVRWEKVQEIRDLQESPHLACGHLLAEGEEQV